MHLLDVRTRKLKRFGDGNVPPYAILSHTWGDDEISYQEIERAGLDAKKIVRDQAVVEHNGAVKEKAGQEKVRKGKKSLQDRCYSRTRLHWIDACCTWQCPLW